MRNRILSRILFGLAATFPLICAADVVSTTADLSNNKPALSYMFSPALQESMYRLGVEQDRKFGLATDCKSQYQINPISATVIKPIEFLEGKPNPTRGVWLTRYQLVRCGDSKTYNALFFADNSAQMPASKAFYPGTGHAGPTLIADAMMPAVLGALARSGLKDCKNVDVLDMRVSQVAHTVVEADKTFAGVWNEIWTFKMCDKTIDVAMTFIPDANGGGTTFSSGPVTPATDAVRP